MWLRHELLKYGGTVHCAQRIIKEEATRNCCFKYRVEW